MTKHHRIFLYVAALCTATLTACSTVSYTSYNVDILRPARYTLPSHVERLVIIDCADTNKLIDTFFVPLDVEQRSYLRRMPDMICSFVATNIMRGSGFEVKIETHHFSVAEATEKAAEICNRHNADALILLHNFDYQTDLIDVSGNFLTCYALVGAARSQITVLLPQGGRMDLAARQDTMFWSQCDIEPDEALLKLPHYSEVYYSVAENVGAQQSQLIVPQWQTQIRYILASQKKTMQDAMQWTHRGNWENAANLWHEEYRISLGAARARAAYDLALFYEQDNQIDNAIEWCQKAADFYGEKPQRKYSAEAEVVHRLLKLLKQRRDEFEILDQQVRQ